MRHSARRPPSVVDRVLDLLGAFTAERPRLTLSELQPQCRACRCRPRTGSPVSSRGAGPSCATKPAPTASGCGCGKSPRSLRTARSCGKARCRSWKTSTKPRTRTCSSPCSTGPRSSSSSASCNRCGAVNVLTRVGGRLPAHATGVGQVLLAHASAEVQEEVLAGPLKTFTPKTIASPALLRRVLADVRRDGYVISDGQVELVALSVAAPVRDTTDEVVAAISVVVPAGGTDPRTLVPASPGRGTRDFAGAGGTQGRAPEPVAPRRLEPDCGRMDPGLPDGVGEGAAHRSSSSVPARAGSRPWLRCGTGASPAGSCWSARNRCSRTSGRRCPRAFSPAPSHAATDPAHRIVLRGKGHRPGRRPGRALDRAARTAARAARSDTTSWSSPPAPGPVPFPCPVWTSRVC